MSTVEEFHNLDMRVGKIVKAEPFPEAHKPAYRLQIDFGDEVGVKRSTAQLTKHYRPDDLTDKLVIGVVNLPPRQIGPAISECLTLGVPDENGECVLIEPEQNVPLGGKVY